MTATINLETQGISDDWSAANGEFDTRSRGMLKEDQVLSAMLHLAPLDTPDTDDPCPPHILTDGKAGSFSFVGQGGTIYCADVDRELTPRQAADLALGKSPAARPPPMPGPSGPGPSVTGARATGTPADRPIMKRKFGWVGLVVLFLSVCFVLAAVVMAFGVVSMQDRGAPEDDILAATTMGIGFGVIAILLFFLARKARRKYYVDRHGGRVNEDGADLPFVMMAHHLGTYDADDGDDGDYGDDGGGDDGGGD